MHPDLSIIIPTLNEEEYLPRLLDDLSQQKMMNFEVIVVDASEDRKTKDTTLKTHVLYPLSLYSTNKKNVAHQRNLGAAYAQGQYLVFLDADTRIPPDFTRSLITASRKNPGLVFRPYTIPEDRRNLEISSLFVIWNIIVELSFSTSSPFGDGACMIFDKNLFHTIGGYNEKMYIGEDHEIMRRCARWGVRPKMLPDVVAIFSQRRMLREGKLQLLYKYTLIGLHSLLKMEVKEDTLSYKMGGRVSTVPSLSTTKIKALKRFFAKDYRESVQEAIRKFSNIN